MYVIRKIIKTSGCQCVKRHIIVKCYIMALQTWTLSLSAYERFQLHFPFAVALTSSCYYIFIHCPLWPYSSRTEGTLTQIWSFIKHWKNVFLRTYSTWFQGEWSCAEVAAATTWPTFSTANATLIVPGPSESSRDFFRPRKYSKLIKFRLLFWTNAG